MIDRETKSSPPTLILNDFSERDIILLMATYMNLAERQLDEDDVAGGVKATRKPSG